MKILKTNASIVPLAIFGIALLYYGVLSAKDFTWLFVSQDSGDWLTASTIWIVPQPYGSPLYIFLGHLLNLLPGGLPLKMTLLLSVLPSAITVSLVYLIALEVTGKRFTAVISSAVLLGAAVFLTQSIILEEYALTAMFLVLAYFTYLKGHKKLMLLALGCATAVHIIGLVFFMLWAWVEFANWRAWWKYLWIYLFVGIVPYIYVPILMALQAPPFMAGYWSFEALWQYLFRTTNAVVFQISVFDFPLRFMLGVGVTVVSLGIATIPAMIGFWKRPWSNSVRILIVSSLFPLIYYLLCLDPSTWTFLTFGLPFFSVIAGIGLKTLYNRQQRVVLAGAILFIILNSFALNPTFVEAFDHSARDAKAQIEVLPPNSAVLTYPGSYSMLVYYVNSTSRPDLIPLVWQGSGNGSMIWEYEDLKVQYQDYGRWLEEKYGVEATIPLYQAQELLNKGHRVFVAAPIWVYEQGMNKDSWTYALKEWFMLEGTDRIREVRDVRFNSP